MMVANSAQLPDAWTALRPHALQGEAWTTKFRFVGLDCGRGSGKTELAKRRLVRFLNVRKPWPNPRYFYAAPIEAQAKLIAWDDLWSLIPPEWEPRRKDGNKIWTKFGSHILVAGLDKPQRIEGVQWDGGVIDESCDIKPGTFSRSIMPTLMHRKGWCWRIGVPKRFGVGAKEFRTFCEDARAGKLQDSAAWTWPSSDILPPAEIAVMQANLDAKDCAEQLGATWLNAGGGVFHAFDVERNVRPCAYDPKRAIIVGSDFNVNPMAWCLGHKIKDRLEWFDEIWLRDTNTQAALDVLHARYPNHQGGWEFYGDSSGRGRQTSASASDYQQIWNDSRFVKMGRTVHYPKGPPPVLDRIAACNLMLCNADDVRRMHIDPRCEQLISDLTSRYFRPGSSEIADKDDLGHMTDAMGYAIMKLFPIRTKAEIVQQPVIIVQ